MKKKKLVKGKSLTEFVLLLVRQKDEKERFNTAHVYLNAYKSFARFVGECDAGKIEKEELHFGVLTSERLIRFQSYLRRKGKSWNTVSTYIRMLRAIYNRAVALRLTQYVPGLFDEVYTKITDTKRALEAEEMGDLLQNDGRLLDEPLRNTLQLFQLLFLLRGMPFVDLAHLRKSDLQGNKLCYQRQKTGRELTVLLTPELMERVERCIDQRPDSDYLFPILNPTLEDAHECYKDYQRALQQFNNRLSLVAFQVGLNEKLTSYTPRHTWATVGYQLDIATDTLCQSMGHSSFKVTKTYIKVLSNKKIDEANELIISYTKNCAKRLGKRA